MNQTITFVDPFGRMVEVSRADWQDQVLRPNLQQHWNDPDRLYGIIFTALQEGHFEEVADATARLLEIDPDPERSHAMRSIVLTRLGRLDDAQSILDAGVALKGETGTLLTNLAKVAAERGDKAAAEALLWKAVRADPNMEHGLPWWLSLEREREGEAGLLAALTRACALPGAWRPQLGLAGYHLAKGDPQAAAPLVAVALDAYDPRVHGTEAGMQLLSALLALGQWREGEALASRLYALSNPAILQPLDQFSDAFAKLRASQQPARARKPDGEVFHRGYEGPVWTYGLRDPKWLLRAKPADGASVAFFPLALHGEENPGPGLTRAIPLYLAEATHYWTDFKAVTYLTLMKDEGPVVTGDELDGAMLCEHLGPPIAHFVTGVLDTQGPEWKVSLKLWDRARKTCTVNVEGSAPAGHVGPLVLALEERIRKALGKERFKPFDHFYARPAPEAMDGYINAIGISSMLALVAHGLAPKDRLWGERAMLELPLLLALQFPANEAMKLMFISGLVKATEYPSDVLPEFEMRALQFMKDAAFRGSVAAPFEPAVLAVFGQREAVERHRAALSPDVDTNYRAWLEAIAGK